MLHLLSTHVLSTTFFPVWMRSFETAAVAASPISLIADNMASCEQMMLRGEAHFLLCHHHPAAHIALPDEHFASIAVGSDRLIAVSAPEAPEAETPLHRLESSAPTILAYSDSSGMGRIIDAVGAQPHVTPAFVSPLAGVLYAMARDGKGVAWLPETLIQPSLERGDLVRASGKAEITIEIRLFRPRAPQSSVAEAFWSAAEQTGQRAS
jgi:DNA-binding transcriptional LysR family regulator